MVKGNAMAKGVMRMAATTRSEYRPKCVIDIKYLPPQLMLVAFCAMIKPEKKYSSGLMGNIKFEKCEKKSAHSI